MKEEGDEDEDEDEPCLTKLISQRGEHIAPQKLGKGEHDYLQTAEAEEEGALAEEMAENVRSSGANRTRLAEWHAISRSSWPWFRCFFVFCSVLANVLLLWSMEDAVNHAYRKAAPTLQQFRVHEHTTRSIGSRPSALIAIPHWKTELPMTPWRWRVGVDRAVRQRALMLTLQTFRSYSVVTVDIILATNSHIPEADGLVYKQIVKPRPRCDSTLQHHHCMPWEALSAMRQTAANKTFRHDFYIYLESDILIPEATFHFWQMHSDRLRSRGYSLIPYRQTVVSKAVVATDFKRGGCAGEITIYYDNITTPDIYSDPLDRIFIHTGCLYAASWLMTRHEYRNWLEHGRSEFEHFRKAKHLIRENAACGGAPCFPWERLTHLTHFRMVVFHQLFAGGGEFDYPVADLEGFVNDCAGNRGMCVPLNT